jgi:serine protease Do
MKHSPKLSALGAILMAVSLGLPASLNAESLKERQAKVSAVLKKTTPTVVAIQSRSARAMGSGSGVIVSADGIILTAAHVVDATGGRDDSPEVAIVLTDGREVKGKVLGRDRNRDAAMVQILGGGDWPHAELALADSVEQGEWCLAMGHPGGFDSMGGAPVRVGRLWLNNDKAFYRSDCTVSGGDSGGPLFDLEGRVIGIHSNISMDVAENRHVPIRVFHEGWDRLKKGETWGDARNLLADSDDLRPKGRSGRATPEKRTPREPDKDLLREPAGPSKGDAFLGIALENADDGVAVKGIAPSSPAEKAGFQNDDVITRVDGKAVGSTGDVISRVHDSAPGDKLKFTIKRGEKEENLEVTLAARE